jgi:hypothetical protein
MSSQVAVDMRLSEDGADVRLPSRVSFALPDPSSMSLIRKHEQEKKRDAAKEHRSSLFGIP